MKRISILTMSLIFSAVAMMAEVTKALTVTTIDGQKQSVALSAYPLITMTGGNLVVKTDAAEFQFDLQQVDKFVYEDVDISSIESVSDAVTSTFRQEGNMLYFTAGDTAIEITVTTISGITMYRNHLPANSMCSLSIYDYTQGTYLVTTNSTTYKIIKK